MKPIHPTHQRFDHDQGTISLASASMPFRLLRTANAYNEVGVRAMVEEIQAGHWDHAIATGHGSPRSLLLTWLGSQPWALEGATCATGEASELAAALEGRGASPWEQDAEGRDALDQAFAVGALDLVERWAPSIPSSSTPLDARCYAQPKGVASSMEHHAPRPWLHEAARQKNVDAVRMLVRLGMDPNQLDGEGNTALFWVGDGNVAKALVELGADPSRRNRAGQSPEAFWVGVRGEPANSAKEWAKAAGLTGRKSTAGRSRQDLLVDFYASVDKAPRTILAPMFNRLNLQVGEVDPATGLSPVGLAARRILPHAKEAYGYGREQAASSSWVAWLFNETHAPSLAVREDWAWHLLALGRSNAYPPGTLSRLRPTSLDKDFFAYAESCMRQSVDEKQRPLELAGLSEGLARGIRAAMQAKLPHLDMAPAVHAYYAALETSGRERVNFHFRTSGGEHIEKLQQKLLEWLRLDEKDNPACLSPDAWRVALLFVPPKSEKSTALHVPLLEFLADKQVPLPPDMVQEVPRIVAQLPERDRACMSQVLAMVLDHSTPSSAPARRGPRL